MNFNDYEEKGRISFQKNFLDKIKPSKVVFAKDEYSPYDCIFILNNTIYITEIKQRQASYYRFPDMFLEYKKYRSLIVLKEALTIRTDIPIKLFYVHTYENMNNIRYTTLDETYILKDFKKESHQRSQVYSNGDKLKFIKYLTKNIH